MNHTLNQLLRKTTEHLEAVFHNDAAAEHNAWWLLEALLKKPRLTLLLEPTTILTQEQQNLLDQWIYEIVHDHKPIAYVLGNVDFLGLSLNVEPPILIPRQETEEWCSYLINEIKKTPAIATILDICTGSGCIALALATAFPKAHVTALDIEPQALNLTMRNAKINGIANVHCILSDLYTALDNSEKYDLIVSNPPYISFDEWHSVELSVKNWEDHKALITEDDGLYLIKKIITGAATRLNNQRQLWIEMGYQQGPAVKQLFEDAGFVHVKILKDLQGNDRVVTGILP